MLGIKRRRVDPNFPLINSWELSAADKNARIDEQLESINDGVSQEQLVSLRQTGDDLIHYKSFGILVTDGEPEKHVEK